MTTLASPHVAEAIIRTRSMNFATGIVVIYDHMCSLDKEVNFIWRRRPWTRGTLLFLLNRYLPYVYILMAIEENWLIASPTACQRRDIANAIIVSCGIITSGVILSLRTWAIWERNQIIKWILLTVPPISVVVVSVCFSFMFRNAPYITITPEEAMCYSVIEPSYWVTITFAIILVIETQMAGLALVKAVQARHSNSKWVFKIHYMGIVYYLYILLMSIINVVVTVHLHHVGIQSFSIIQGALHSVLSNRVVFMAREPSALQVSDSTYDDSIYDS